MSASPTKPVFHLCHGEFHLDQAVQENHNIKEKMISYIPHRGRSSDCKIDITVTKIGSRRARKKETVSMTSRVAIVTQKKKESERINSNKEEY